MTIYKSARRIGKAGLMTDMYRLQREADCLGYALVPKHRIKIISTTCDMVGHEKEYQDEYTERYLLSQTAYEIASKLAEHKKYIIRKLSYDEWNDTTRMIIKFDVIVPK